MKLEMFNSSTSPLLYFCILVSVPTLLVSCIAAALWGLASAAPFSGTLTATNGNHKETINIPRHSAFTSSLGVSHHLQKHLFYNR